MSDRRNGGAEQAQGPDSPAPPQPQPAPKRGNTGLLITLILLGVAILLIVPVVVLVAGILYFRSSQGTETAPPPPQQAVWAPPPETGAINPSVDPPPVAPTPASPDLDRVDLAELLGPNGFVLRVFPADLDGSRPSRERWHKVHVVPAGEGQFGERFGLVVTDADNGVIWRSPPSDDDADPLVFGRWDHGECLPEMVADIDADGKVELVAREGGGDVSPVQFRTLEWDGSAFVPDPARSKVFLNSPFNSPGYPASNGDPSHGRWIHRLWQQHPGGELWAEIWETDESVSSVSIGRAEVKPSPTGFQLARWVAPLIDSELARFGPEDDPIDPLFADPTDSFLRAWRMGSATEALDYVVLDEGGGTPEWYRDLITQAPGLRMNLGHSIIMAREHRGIGLVRVKVWLADGTAGEFHFEFGETDRGWKIDFGE